MNGFRVTFFLVVPLVFAVMAGPFALALGQGDRGTGDIYLLVSRVPDAAIRTLQSYGAQPVGPEMARFGAFMTADKDSLNAARDAGFLMIPATTFAAICGITPSLKDAT